MMKNRIPLQFAYLNQTAQAIKLLFTQCYNFPSLCIDEPHLAETDRLDIDCFLFMYVNYYCRMLLGAF